jgi:hypothetical protein
MTDSLLPEHRERLYPPTLALSTFTGQALEEAGSCQKARRARRSRRWCLRPVPRTGSASWNGYVTNE